MKYLTERSLFYYFLMREIKDAGTELWSTIANDFGVSQEVINRYEITLENPVLSDLVTAADIEVYKNYINGFFCEENCFGKSPTEIDTIEAKLLALQTAQQLFGNTQQKQNRLQLLSRNYEGDRVASVLYALHIIHFNNDKSCRTFAGNILAKELHDEKNCDAGFVLLQLKDEETDKTVAALKSLPEMLIRSEMMDYLKDRFGEIATVVFDSRRTIGF